MSTIKCFRVLCCFYVYLLLASGEKPKFRCDIASSRSLNFFYLSVSISRDQFTFLCVCMYGTFEKGNPHREGFKVTLFFMHSIK